jgi:hypothetical protein
MICVSLSLKAPEASPHSDLAVCLETLQHYLPLSVILPQILEELFLLGVVLPYHLL